MIETLSVIEVIDPIASGMTEPYRCRLSDDNLYAVKGRQALIKGLISETVCAHLARKMGIPIPDFAIAHIDQVLITAAGDPQFNSSIGAGYGFASLWIEPTQPLPRSLIPELDSRLMATIYAFDHWIKNGDRSLTEHGGNPNLMIELGSNSLIAFDHNLAFSESYSPTELEVHACREAWLDESKNLVFRGECERKFDEASSGLRHFIDDLPTDWLDAEDGLADQIAKTLARSASDQFWDEMG
ncbi:HipA family kinase [Qipengyuania sp. GPGPB31]|uniref:HipA family kinase n=1 Tax=Qipengyuania sp. GPGPB31 TaxID=3023518 RepID=UPI0031345769